MTTLATAAPAKHSATNSAGAKAAAEYNEALNINLVDADPENRKDHDKAALQSLADQIKTDGLLQPVLVRPHPKVKGRYMLIAGERRWLAHKLNKATTIRAFIHLSESEASAATKQVIENLGREDLDPIEEARQLQRLVNLGKTQAEVGKLVRNKSQSAVANTLKLLQLPVGVQKIIAGGGITAAHGQELARFAPWPQVCEYIAAAVAKNNANQNEDFINAKWLRDEELPFERELTRKGLAVAIYTGNYSYDSRKQYAVSDELGKKPGFIKTNYEEWHYLLPADPKAANLWEPERAKQDKEREEKAKHKAKTEERTQSKMTPSEKAARQKTINENKQARAESGLGHVAVLERIQGLKDFDGPCLAVIAETAFAAHWKYGSSERIKGIANKLGIKMPSGSGLEVPRLSKMKPLDVLRLTAACICDRESEDCISGGYPIAEQIECVLGAKKTAELKAKAKAQLAAAAAAKAAKKAGKKS